MISYFKELGYLCYGISNDGVNLIYKVDNQTIETNFIFVHEKKHSTIINKLQNM